MPVNYSPIHSPGITSMSTVSRMTHPEGIPAEDIPLLQPTENIEENPGESDQSDILNTNIDGIQENTAYGPDRRYNKASPISNIDYDITPDLSDLEKEEESRSLIIPDQVDDQTDPITGKREEKNFVPSQVIDYYNETAMKAKERNALPDEVFGLPRTRQYPLNDKKHVIQAIRMFGHCKDPEDQKTLANNIVKAIHKFKIDIKIGEKNPLYQYLPKNMQEAVQMYDMKTLIKQSLNITSDSPSDQEARDDHKKYNELFFNQLFFTPEYAKALTAISDLSFLDYFHPDMHTFSFETRLRSVCGGMGLIPEVYDALKMRFPITSEFNQEIGWYQRTDETDEDIGILINVHYTPSPTNWFRVDLHEDMNHIIYCLRLYSILGEIINDPNFTEDKLTENHLALLADWKQHVSYHYDLMKDAKVESDEWYRQVQYLHDLFWSFLYDPENEEDISKMICVFTSNMACVGEVDHEIHSNELVTKQNCTNYLVKTLGYPDSIFLLPGMLKYPILNRNSIHFAMDQIRKVEKEEPDHVDEYVKNLNQKYKELGCSYMITPDHPYAKYASKEMLYDMVYVLAEDSAVNDTDGASDIGGIPNKVEQPWYKRLDYIGALYRDGSENKELGPNTKPMQKPDYQQVDSFL